jgi:hypothetical protein
MPMRESAIITMSFTGKSPLVHYYLSGMVLPPFRF